MNTGLLARFIPAFLAALVIVPSVSAQTTAKKTATAPATVYCAVTDEKIGDAKSAQGTRTYNGKTYYLCCGGCAPQFDKSPAKFAKLADLHGEKRALQAKLSAVEAAIQKESKPSKAAAAVEVKADQSLHCAITGEAIASVKDAAGSMAYNGKTYYFCCPGCVAKFKADPAKYAVEADKRDAVSAKN